MSTSIYTKLAYTTLPPTQDGTPNELLCEKMMEETHFQASTTLIVTISL